MTHFTMQMLANSSTIEDADYWRKEAIRCGAIPQIMPLDEGRKKLLSCEVQECKSG